MILATEHAGSQGSGSGLTVQSLSCCSSRVESATLQAQSGSTMQSYRAVLHQVHTSS